MIQQNPILVTGLHRTGTTWVGRILASAPGIGYIREPFNLWHNAGVCHAPFKHYFQYICPENEIDFLEPMRKTLAFRFDYYHALRSLATNPQANRRKILKDSIKYAYYCRKQLRALIKDPIAFFSTEWLAETFDASVIILVRHPAAFIASLLSMGWNFDFRNFSEQPLLMKNLLGTFKKEIEYRVAHPGDIVEQGILLWRIFTHVIQQYEKSHPDWKIVRHEDLIDNPYQMFSELALYTGIKMSSKIMTKIQRSTSIKNPTTSSSATSINRNTMAIKNSWKKRLTEKQISRIRDNLENVGIKFYSSSDW